MNILLIIAFSVLASAFFSGIEIAFVSANKLKIELDHSRGRMSGNILSWFNRHSSNFIAFLLLGNNIALVVYGIFMEQILNNPITNLLPQAMQSAFFVLLIQTIISTFIILLFAEFLPKIIFRINSNRVLSFFSFILAPIYLLLLPLVYAFITLSHWILKYIFRSKMQDEHYVFSSIDLDYYIKEFHDTDVYSETENDIQIFQNAIEFQDLKIRDCMVPRTDIVGVDENSSLKDLKKLFIDSGHSKIIVYRENIDNIIGYVHVFDLFQQPKSLKSILRELVFVPETMQANSFMDKLIRERKNIAVVLDEFGGTSGVLTLEDLMEEIFGEIEDEFDRDQLVERKIDENTYLFSARQEIDHLNDSFQLKLQESDEYETLGGYITFHHESIPQKGEVINIGLYTYIIIAATNTKIDLIKLIVPESE